MTSVIALLPDWYCCAYAQSGRVSMWQSLRASVEVLCRASWEADPVHLEVLNLFSLATFILFAADARCDWFIQLTLPSLWISIAAALFLIQAAAALSRESPNRAAALGLCGAWWMVLSWVTYKYCGLLTFHVVVPWLALGCIGASSWQKRVHDGSKRH